MSLCARAWKTSGIGTACAYVLSLQICAIVTTLAFIDLNVCVPGVTVVSLFVTIQALNTVFDVCVYVFVVSMLSEGDMDHP